MRRGLTLIELLVYFAVLVLITALAVPAFMGSYKRYKEDALVLGLEKNMRFAQYRAIMEGKAYALHYAGYMYPCALHRYFFFPSFTTPAR